MSVGGGVMRSILCRHLSSRHFLSRYISSPVRFSPPTPVSSRGGFQLGGLVRLQRDPLFGRLISSYSPGASFAGLTDTRFPKRRPGLKPRRKRASLRPPGPYAWVRYVPGEPIAANQPNEGSVKGRNQRKRMLKRKAFILSEEKKRKAQYAESRKKKEIERRERKMAAVARDKAWAERLLELKQLENAKKTVME